MFHSSKTYCSFSFTIMTIAFSCTVAQAQSHPDQQVLEGRQLVLKHGCGGCHFGFANPATEGWLAGLQSEEQIFLVGPFTTYPRNLTPDNSTGIGRFSERQIFNALRYGLRPGETADVEISSSVPGEGNFPRNPKYLAPPMPWPEFRHMKDEELHAIAAFLKRGLKPFSNRVDDSEGPPDFWASEYTEEKYGPYPAPPFPTAAEQGIE
jgi:hypothetical protein